MAVITYDWPAVTSTNPITASQIGPWQHLQEVAASRLVGVAGNPITGRFSAKFIVNSASDRGDPASPNPRTEVYSGGNGAGIIPLNVLAYHGWCFTPVSGNTTTWLNWLQLHGAVSGAQPCFQVKTDHSGGFYCRTNPDGTDRLLAAATPYGKRVRIIIGLKPSTSTSGILQVWYSTDESPYVQKVDYVGRVGFAATYPKGFLYGDAGGAGFPWVNISHKTVINAASYAAVEAALAGSGSTPTPAPLTPSAFSLAGGSQLSGSVTLPSDANRSRVVAVAFPHTIASTDHWDSTDALVLLDESGTSGARTIPAQTVPGGTYYGKAWTIGVGGEGALISSPASVSVAVATSGLTYGERRFEGHDGDAPNAATWRVTKTNQGAGAQAAIAGDELAVAVQSADGTSSRIVLENRDDFSCDFATGDAERFALADFTVPAGACTVDFYLQGDKDVDSPLTGADWARISFDFRLSPPTVKLERRENSGATTTMQTDTLASTPPAGTSVRVQLLLNQTTLRAAYTIGGGAESQMIPSPATHGLAAAMNLASVRMALVVFTTATSPVTTRVQRLKLARKVPYTASSPTLTTLKADGSAWTSGLDQSDLRAIRRVTGTYPSPDDSMPTEYLATSQGEAVGSPTLPVDLGPGPDGTGLAFTLEAANESAAIS